MSLQIAAVVLSSEEVDTVRALFATASSRDDESVTLREAFDTLALLRMPGSKSIPLNFHQKGQLDTMPMEVALQAILSQCPSLYLFEELMNAFAMFAEAAGPIGCITYKALKQALVRYSGVQVLESDIKQLLAEVVASPHDLIHYHKLVSSFYSDSLPRVVA